jgi:transcription initiation factor IIE alpha subunit
MTDAEQKARARWGMDKPEHIAKAEKDGAAEAKRLFAAESRKAERLYRKRAKLDIRNYYVHSDCPTRSWDEWTLQAATRRVSECPKCGQMVEPYRTKEVARLG